MPILPCANANELTNLSRRHRYAVVKIYSFLFYSIGIANANASRASTDSGRVTTPALMFLTAWGVAVALSGVTNTPLTDLVVDVSRVVDTPVSICAPSESGELMPVGLEPGVTVVPTATVTVVKNPWSLKDVLTSNPGDEEPTGKAEDNEEYWGGV